MTSGRLWRECAAYGRVGSLCFSGSRFGAAHVCLRVTVPKPGSNRRIKAFTDFVATDIGDFPPEVISTSLTY